MTPRSRAWRDSDAHSDSLRADSPQPPEGPVRGRFDAAFAEVAEEFARGFALRGELGASLCVRHGGRIVVDLWGGIADHGAGTPWQEDTVSVVFSCTKAATALCIHLLAAQGHLRLDQRISHYWPEYGAEGKGDTTIQMVLDHTAGLPALRQPLKKGCLEDSPYMVEHVEREAPFWRPGTVSGYHAITFGVLLGELVRRTTGSSLGTVFDQLMARTYGLEFWIGLPESAWPRVAPIVPMTSAEMQKSAFSEAAKVAGSIQNLFIYNSGDWSRRGMNTLRGMAVEIPSANGATHARGLSGLYELLQPGAHRELQGLQAVVQRLRNAAPARPSHVDATLLIPTRFSDGFMLGMNNGPEAANGNNLLIGQEAFGHSGAGGAVGFIDPPKTLSFGYTMNRLGNGVLVNQRGQALIDATYRAIAHLA